VKYSFTDRTGGSSTGAFLSNNLATHVGDGLETVLTNRAHLESILGFPVQFMDQVHGNAVASIGAEIISTPTADALVTRSAGIGLAVMVADCIPLLLANSHSVAAVHVGRRGLMNGVALAAIQEMRISEESDNSDITAVVGPSICGNCYEVSHDVYDEVTREFPLAATTTSEGGFALNLNRALTDQLQSLGVTVVDEGRCTVEDGNLYSYRRDGITGRQVGVVWL
jgi:YfiH family protein